MDCVGAGTGSNTEGILKKAKVYTNIKSAINRYDIIFASSARQRDINKRHISLKEFQNIIKRKNLNLGLMFGPEASGLSNRDLSYSNYKNFL